MKTSLLFVPALAALVLTSCSGDSGSKIPAVTYPETRKTDTVDDYFGTKVADPYRWLEDDNSEETKNWVKAQNKVTFGYLEQIPSRNKIKERLTKIWNFEKMSTPYKKGKYYIYTLNNGIQNQALMYYRDGLNGTPKVLLDPNTLSTDGTVSLSGTSISHDGKYMAYGTSKSGSDWVEYDVLEIETGKKLTDHIKWVKFSGVSWQGDGFYYSRYDAPKGSELSAKNEFHKVYFHKVGTSQDEDKLIYNDTDHPNRNFGADVTDDQQWLLVYTTESTSGNALMAMNLAKPNSPMQVIVDNFDNDYGVLDVVGSKMLVRTNKDAPRYRLVEIDINNPAPENWKEIIPQQKELLEETALAGDKIVVTYLVDVKTKVYIYDRNGNREGEIPMPGIVNCNSLSGSKKDSLLFYNVVSYTAPASVYKYNVLTKTTALYQKPNIDFNSDDYETKQVFFPSKDGTKIPMFITHKKGIKLDGSNPCFLFGYGGFNISYTPEFRIDRAVFLEAGGVYAVANMRGGGEYGEEWHKAGTKCQKQNVFDDYIAAAEYLVKENYTNKEKLAIHGRSNGGLLIGAVMTQRPDLCKVCIPQVGVLDMLRYHRFTIGRAWSTDYGLSENQDEFKCLYAYSPLHNVKKVEYPATLIVTGDHDDRVVPAHSFKFAATLQANQQGKNPVLIRIDTNGGHGSGKPTMQQIEEYSDIWAFVFENLGVKY
jgi:prolyl oligopeptidase